MQKQLTENYDKKFNSNSIIVLLKAHKYQCMLKFICKHERNI